MSEYMVQLQKVVKDFGPFKAVKEISLDIKEGEFLTLLGPSGCGKTTTLRMIAGFEEPTRGCILLEGNHVENKQPFERNVNTVFQNYALFPHMNVFQNIGFGLSMKGISKRAIKEKVEETLSLVQLTGYGTRMPDQLSGGQCQRVAIARAIINNPKVLLLDEPLGALDLKLRKQMQVELKRLQKRLGITFIYVTHDQEEALSMSDRIAVMNQGLIEQLGTAAEIYERPQTKFVAEFIGENNLFEAQVVKADGEGAVLELENGRVAVTSPGLQAGQSVYMAIRPDKIRIADSPPKESEPALKGWFKERIYAGPIVKSIVILGNGMEVMIHTSADQTALMPLEEGRELHLTWKMEQAVVVKTERSVLLTLAEAQSSSGL